MTSDIEWTTADQVFIKQIHLKQADALVPQHSHAYAHTTMLAVGKITVWKDGVYQGSYEAPIPIFIEAGAKHLFRTETDETLLFCIHNAARPDVAKVLAAHGLTKEFA